jgi:Domain of unknown function (DUF1844)
MADEKKIFIDEDWKSQVEAEKAAFAGQADPAASADAAGQELPPASFEMLVTTFATEAMVALGQLPNPFTNEHAINWDHARYTIDMLQVLEDKTKGNLSADEAAVLEGLLHQLRMAFVTLQNEYGNQVPGEPPAGSSPIVQP